MHYDVEYHLPSGPEAEDYARFQSFDEAFNWLEQHLLENPQRIGRFRTRAIINPDQTAKLARYNIENLMP